MTFQGDPYGYLVPIYIGFIPGLGTKCVKTIVAMTLDKAGLHQGGWHGGRHEGRQKKLFLANMLLHMVADKVAGMVADMAHGMVADMTADNLFSFFLG